MTHEVVTSKGTFLFVGVAEGFGKDASINRDQDHPEKKYLLLDSGNSPKGFIQYTDIWLDGDAEIISLLSELTEEQARGIVEEVEFPLSSPTYKDYLNGGKKYSGKGIKGIIVGYSDPIESLHSLMQSERLFVQNPYGEDIEDILPKGSNDGSWQCVKKDFDEAQSRTFKEWLILRKK